MLFPSILKVFVVLPTGGGKTNVGIFDAVRVFQSETPQTVVVVSPRILAGRAIVC